MKSIIARASIAAAVLWAGSAGAEEHDSRPYNRYATKECKSATCFSNHPSGSYTFPYHERHSTEGHQIKAPKI